MDRILENLHRCNDKCTSIVINRAKGIIPHVIGGQLRDPDLVIIGLNPGKCDTTERFLYKEYSKNDPKLIVKLTNHFLMDRDSNTYGGRLGELLSDIFGEGFLEKAYLTNLVKCESEVNGIVDPKTIEHCYGKFLKEEINLLKPKLILALGKSTMVYDFLREQGYNNVVQCVHPSTRGKQLKFWDKGSPERKELIKQVKTTLSA